VLQLIKLNYRDSRPIYEQIKDALQKLILTGAIAADEKLPSVRELASTMALNPNTIQRAYRELESEGYIYSIAGKGSFAAVQKETYDRHKSGLFEQFDKTVHELLTLGVEKEELCERIDQQTKGGSDE
jgi:GntR family transcriptional regulator